MTSADTFLTQLERLFSQKTTSNGIGNESHVFSLILIAPVRKEPSSSSEVVEYLLIFTKVIIRDIEGSYYLVEKEGEKVGYMHYFWLAGGKAVTLELNRDYDHVYVNGDNENRTKAKYNGVDTITWSTDSPDIISVNSSTGKITGIKPGLAKVTAKAGNKTDTAEIACINAWKEPETAKAKKSIEIKELPSSESDTIGTISAGTSIVAKGDLADGSGWIYVNAGGYWGFIKLDDFPGIDYLMTEYHCYDKGYNLRFGSASAKIYDYASVLNDVMMKQLNIKINPVVSSYVSGADKCKELRFGTVASNNLDKSCPKTTNHNSKSCLTTSHLHNSLLRDKGKANHSVTNIVWTGHMLDGNARSTSIDTNRTIVITLYKSIKTTSTGYVLRSSSEIRKNNISTLMHETIHQFGVADHYCYEDASDENEPCTNTGCYKCYGDNIAPDCMMMVTKYPTVEDNLLCDDCKKQILEYVAKN